MQLLTAKSVEEVQGRNGPYQKVTWDSGKTDHLFKVKTKIVQGKAYEVDYVQNPKNPTYYNVGSLKEATTQETAGPVAQGSGGHDSTFRKQQECIFLNTCLKAASEITAAAVGPFASRENVRPEDIDNFAVSFYSKMAKKIISDFMGMMPFGSSEQAKIPEASGVYGRVEKTVEDPGL